MKNSLIFVFSLFILLLTFKADAETTTNSQSPVPESGTHGMLKPPPSSEAKNKSIETQDSEVVLVDYFPYVQKVEITNLATMEVRYTNEWTVNAGQIHLQDPEIVQLGTKIGIGPGTYQVEIEFSETMDWVASTANLAKVYFTDDCQNYADIEVAETISVGNIWTGAVTITNLPKPTKRDCLWMRVSVEHFLDLTGNEVISMLPPHNPYVYLDPDDDYFKIDIAHMPNIETKMKKQSNDRKSKSSVIPGIHKIKVFAVENSVFLDVNASSPYDGTWEHPYDNFYDAIAYCPDNGTIYVAPGNYQRSCSYSSCWEILKNVTIIAQTPLETICGNTNTTAPAGYFKVGDTNPTGVCSLSIFGIYFKGSAAIDLFDASLHAEGNIFRIEGYSKDYHDSIMVHFYWTTSENVTLDGNVFDGEVGSKCYTEVAIPLGYGGTLTIKNNVFQNSMVGVMTICREPQPGWEHENIFFNNSDEAFSCGVPMYGDYHFWCYSPQEYYENKKFGDINPQFVDPVNGDYHILPNSPLLNSGVGEFSGEPNYYSINTSRNMGAYGNTSQAYFRTLIPESAASYFRCK